MPDGDCSGGMEQTKLVARMRSPFFVSSGSAVNVVAGLEPSERINPATSTIADVPTRASAPADEPRAPSDKAQRDSLKPRRRNQNPREGPHDSCDEMPRGYAVRASGQGPVR